MTDEETKVAAPTVGELTAKVTKLETQLAIDQTVVADTTSAFKSVMKSGDVDKALEAADKRTVAIAAYAKTTSQLKTAANAIKSAQYAANADKIASIHDRIREGKLNVPDAFAQLESLGVDLLTIDRSEETGKLIVNSSGPAVKRTRAGGGGGGGKGSPLTVDGESFASAAAALAQHRPDFEGKMGRAAIVSWLTNAGHEVS